MVTRRKSAGIVQIAHGMTEHAGVYTEFIDALLEAGYGVYAHDHKGHGKTVKEKRTMVISSRI